jgi:hypothetical protein
LAIYSGAISGVGFVGFAKEARRLTSASRQGEGERIAAMNASKHLKLDAHDQAIVDTVRKVMTKAISTTHSPVAVTKRIAPLAMRYRNKRRAAAIRKHPFKGVCEESGRPLDFKHAVLDELEPELGYAGKVRWVCVRAKR